MLPLLLGTHISHNSTRLTQPNGPSKPSQPNEKNLALADKHNVLPSRETTGQKDVISGRFNKEYSPISLWTERWFGSSNAKDIGTLYLIFALLSGLVGTAFSVLIRLELSGPGVQFIADNQLYNSIITAHAIVMSAPMRFAPRKSHQEIMDNLCHVKSIEVGMVKPYGETPTTKLYVKGLIRQTVESLGFRPDLSYMEIRITNLIHMVSHNGTLPSLNSKGGWVVPWNDIISVPAKVNVLPDNTQSVNNICKYQHITFRNEELRDHLRGPVTVPNNYSTIKLRNRVGPLIRPINRGGDGVVIICLVSLGKRTTGFNSGAKYSSKADQIKLVTRGSEENIRPANDYVNQVSIKNIANLKILIAAYELIKSKPGNMTVATDKVTLDGISIEYLTKVQSRLRAGTYEFPPARRIQIPKPGKIETRPLTIASPRDKIVQKAMQLIMEPLYEKQFLDTSHGFRPNRGTRTAIQYLDAKFQSVHYVIEADFSKAFDTIPHKKLMGIISREINCEKTLKLINSGLKAGYIEFGKLHQNLADRTPQGSILSPLLCNIYFHELDTYMENIKQEYNCGTKRGTNKEYEKLANRVSYMRKKGLDISNRDEYLDIMRKMLNTPSKKQDDSYIRIHYVRYADDFVIGIEGSHEIAKTILEKVKTFISSSLSLKLNDTKIGITNYSKKKVKFLGYNISAPHFKGNIKPRETINQINYDKIISRRKKIRIRIEMDTEKVFKRLETNRFIRKRNTASDGESLEYRGTFKGNLINLDHADILKYYNSVIRGVYNYYSFVNNTQDLAHVIWRITESCALTLARKFKLRTMSLAYRKFGKDLGCNIELKDGQEKRVSIFLPDNFKKINITKGVNIDKDPFKTIESIWNSKFTKSKLFQSCILCDSRVDVEMHHVRKIRDLKDRNSKLDFYTRQMAAINRKQVPLCRTHHAGLHNDTWTEIEKTKSRSVKQKNNFTKRFISSTSVRRSWDPTKVKPPTLQSFLDWPHIFDIITYIKNREDSGEVLWECDYSFITSALLPYYFHHTHNTTWVITPEYNHLENNHPDYTIFSITRNPFRAKIHAVVELKSKTGKSWEQLLKQMWVQCDVVVGSSDEPFAKLWAIGQKGLEICIFKFDL